jgi:alpha-galactosidase
MGVYDLYERLTSTFPDVLIEGCAAGGGRYDLGIMYYSPQIWTSDDTDAVERMKIQFGTTTAYPLSVLSNHVSAIPNHQLGRMTSLETRGNVAFFGPLGYELDITKLSNEEKAAIADQIASYKQHRDLIMNGTFVKLISPFEGNKNEMAWAVVSEDKTEALVGFYRVLAEPNNRPFDYLQLPFLDESKHYEIEGREQVVAGSLLASLGIRKPYQYNGANDATYELKGDYQSHLFHLTAK